MKAMIVPILIRSESRAMVFSGIFIKTVLFFIISGVNENVMHHKLNVFETVFVMELIQEVYGKEKEEEDQ